MGQGVQRAGHAVLSGQSLKHTHKSHLIIDVVLVGVVLVKNQLKKLPHSIHINRLEFPGFAACLFIITEGDIAQSAEPLCLVRHQVLRQAFTNVELDFTGDHVLVSK